MITEADTCRKYVLPKLRQAGWTDDQISEQKYFTDGRIVPAGRGHKRRKGNRADYLLKFTPDYPIAVVEAKSAYKQPGDGLQQAMEYAEILGLKFAYSTNGKGIVEHDFTTGRQSILDAFPTPDELWRRLKGELRIADKRDEADLLSPLNRELRTPDGEIKVPRYFQQIAIDRAVHAIIRGRKRILLTMATGTGKTFVAAQVVWKLWKAGRKKRILYLADRDILIQQPFTRDFSMFGHALHRIQGEAKMGREIYFALYQSIAEDEQRPGLYREYPPDYFDLIVVDECHRGSARDASNWRRILEYFEPAVQLGMTATPLRRENVDTYRYFGDPIYTYSLADGIRDGFLAPFRVHRVVPSVDATGWRPDLGQLDRFGREIPEGLYTTRDFERVVSLLTRTEAVAKHLTAFMKRTDRYAKTIVFCVDSEHADQVRMALNNANLDLAREHPNYVARIVALEGDVGRKHLDDFQDPERPTPTIVTTSQLLSTGVDVPTCRNIVLFKPIGSMVEFKQIIGRGTRLCPEKDKLWFDILDYTGATALFEDPDFDGAPEALTEEEIDENGDPIPRIARAGEVAEPVEAFGDVEPEFADDDEGERRKRYVDGVSVSICAEVVYELDPNGKRVRAVRYTAFTARQVRTLFASASTLKRAWSEAEQRSAIVESLDERGVSLDHLAEEVAQPEADPLDLLLHVAWNAPLRTRRERAEMVRKGRTDFFDRYTPEARAILNELLDKYADYGLGQLDDLRVLEVPPISDHGTPVEIAATFGGPQQLKDAINDMQRMLYVA